MLHFLEAVLVLVSVAMAPLRANHGVSTTDEPLCPNQGETANVNADTSNMLTNYFVNRLDTSALPLTPGVCQPSSIATSTYVKGTCEDSGDLRITTHESKACPRTDDGTDDDYLLMTLEIVMGDDVTLIVFNTMTNETVPKYSGYIGDYNCDGRSFSTSIAFSPSDPTCATPAEATAALGVCITPDTSSMEAAAVQMRVYCDEGGAELQDYVAFAPEDMCATLCLVRSAGLECDLMFTVASLGDLAVYGYMVDCDTDPVEPTDDDDDGTEDGDDADDDKANTAHIHPALLLLALSAYAIGA